MSDIASQHTGVPANDLGTRPVDGLTAPTPEDHLVDLAARQWGLVNALLGGAADPPGFAPELLAAARHALAHKRAGEVAHRWPELARAYGSGWVAACAAVTVSRPTSAAMRTGWVLALRLADDRALTNQAARELALAATRWRMDTAGELTPRTGRGLRWGQAGDAVVLTWGERRWWLRAGERRQHTSS